MTKVNKTAWMDIFTHNYEEGQIFELPILSGSMAPLLKPGYKLRLQCMSWEKCHIGDIILFKRGTELIAHRLLWKMNLSGTGIILQKGDANQTGEFIHTSHVIGKVIVTEGVSGDFRKISETRATARQRAAKELLKLLLAWILLLPRSVKKWIQKNH